MKHRAYVEKLDSGLHVITLTSPAAMARIAPAAGFNLFSFVFRGRELMMPAQDVGAGGDLYGTPILFPTPGRTKDSTYTYRGETHTLTKGGAARYLHGFMLDSPFAYALAEDEAAREGAACEGAACEGVVIVENGDALGYPFPCAFNVRVALVESTLHYKLTVRNIGARTMPFGAAIHPYFTRGGDGADTYLSCPAPSRYEADAALLPSGALLGNAGGGYDLTVPQPLSALDLDTVYHGLSAKDTTRIEYRSWNVGVDITADDAFLNRVLYTPPHRPGFCVEPQTCSADFINLHEAGCKHTGIIELEPGGSWSGNIKISARQLGNGGAR